MKSFEASVAIDAPPERVWEVLVDTKAWPEWDPFTDRIEGEVTLGGKVTAYSKLSPGRGFGVKVSELDAPKKMAWTGGMPFGLFKGHRTYVLRPDGDGTRFTMREEFTGPMLALIGRSLPDMTEAFESFVNGLKARAEGG